MELIARYLAAHAAVNVGVDNRPTVEPTSSPGWYKFNGKPMGRKTLLKMTERLENARANWDQWCKEARASR